MSGAVVQLEEITTAIKRSRAYAELLWRRYARKEEWPDKLNIYEAAAYLRVDYKSIWRACQPGRDGRARLAHQRIGSEYRIDRADLDGFGRVEARRAAA